jgi:GntR family transcriptional repressor for pyruvate dehydrogenase complex
MAFTPVKKHSIADAITRQILGQILKGLIKPGERLPPERELAVTFDTNRNTLREAIRNLQTLNVVEARQGDGLKVRDFRECGELNLLPHYLREAPDTDELMAVLEDVLHVRRLLLADVCTLVAARATPAQLDAIHALVDLQRAQADEPEKLVRTDLDISLALVKASRSITSRWLFNSVARVYTEIVFQFPALWVFTPDYADNYDAVVAAARTGDGQKARTIMDAHLEQSDRAILDAVRALSSMMG